jgi:protein ImuB
LALRFGPEIGRRLDQALGHVVEPIAPIRPAELIEVRRSFAEPITAAETIARYNSNRALPASAMGVASAPAGSRLS